MRFLSFSTGPGEAPRPGVLLGEAVVALPFEDLLAFIAAGPQAWRLAAGLAAQILEEGVDPKGRRAAWPYSDIALHPPLARPPAFRDFYAFEQHVATSYANRGREVPSQWYEFPVFYFSNPGAFYGPEAHIPCPKSSHALDYELEVACVIGKAGRDLTPEGALDHIFGYTILNDWSARDLQRREMRVGLGPAKGKDFASSLGPWIVTPDELAERATDRPGVFDLDMRARVNGVERSRGNWRSIHYSFGELLARASADVTLHPGEVIGSGTVGSGCLLELTRGAGPWLQAGDVVELEIERLGVLRNTVSGQAD